MRKAISLNLTKKTKMRTKSSSTKTSKSSRRDRKDRDIDGKYTGKVNFWCCYFLIFNQNSLRYERLKAKAFFQNHQIMSKNRILYKNMTLLFGIKF